MLRKVDAAGTPAVDDGAKIKRDFRANLAKLRDVLVQAKDDAEKIPVDTPDHFASASEKWGKDVFSHFESVSGTFDELGKKYKSDEIENAAKSEPACKDLSNS
jgi:hypothetical protein